MADFLSFLTAIPGLISDFSGSTSNPYQKQQEELAARQNQISQAMTDTNNPLYQQMYGQYKQQGQNQMADMIAEAQGQNRMNANMGRTPLFSNERGSENIFRSMMQQQQGAGVQADQQTRAALGQALSGANTAQSAYTNPYTGVSPYAKAQNAQQLQGYQGIYNLLKGQTGQQPPQQPPSTGSMGAGFYQPQQQQNFVQQPAPYMGFQY